MISKDDIQSEVLIVAAEASSSLYAQRLLEFWKSENFKIKAFGVGSKAMESLGFECLGRAEDMAVVGLMEVVQHYPHIKHVFEQICLEAKKRKPIFALLLDYPDFNLRLASRLKVLSIPVIYYISPQLWAWRKSRLQIVKKYVDHMLVLFPFEEEFYKKHGIKVTFVGYPLLDEIKSSLQNKQKLRESFGFTSQDVVFGLMPGSRNSEIKHHLQTQIEVAEQLKNKYSSNLKVLLLVAPTLKLDEIKKHIDKTGLPIVVIQREPFEMIQLCDLILCASGTATVMVGLMQVPMVIMYKMNFLSAIIARLLVRSTPYFGMVNLILGREIVPERFQSQASVAELCKLLEPLLSDPQVRQKESDALAILSHKLGDCGATQRVAEILEGYLNKPMSSSKKSKSKTKSKTKTIHKARSKTRSKKSPSK